MTSPRFLAIALACLATTFAVAQDAPPPPGPFPPPVTGYVGRYLDSSSTPDFACCPRTFRAHDVKAVPERDALYMIVGSTFVRQTLSTFVQRVRTEPLQTESGPGVVRGVFPGEKYLAFDDWVDPERSPGWTGTACCGQDQLFDFDWDDRGLTYLAYSSFGLGIVDENLDLVHQIDAGTLGIRPDRVVAFRSGGRYYVMASDNTIARLYDVTNPAAPVLVPSNPMFFFRGAARTSAFIALIGPSPDATTQAIQIFTPAALVAGGAPAFTLLVTPGQSFRDITTDGTSFYAIEQNFFTVDGPMPGTVHVLTPAGNTFTHTTTPVAAPHNTVIDYGAGYVVVGSGSPTEIGVGSELFPTFRRATIFSTGPGGLTFEGELHTDYFPNEAAYSFLPLLTNGETVLIAAMHGVGDVFSLAPSPAVVAAADVPAMSLWALLATSALLGMIGLTRIRS
jgi:hypothetical protein